MGDFSDVQLRWPKNNKMSYAMLGNLLLIDSWTGLGINMINAGKYQLNYDIFFTKTKGLCQYPLHGDSFNYMMINDFVLTNASTESHIRYKISTRNGEWSGPLHSLYI